jgi:hypothetical protein
MKLVMESELGMFEVVGVLDTVKNDYVKMIDEKLN